MEVVTGLYRLRGLQGANAFIWHPRPSQRGKGEPILFDCGWPWSRRPLVAGLEAAGCLPADIAAIAVTHFDFDHVGTLASLASAGSAEVMAHEREASSISGQVWRRLPATGRSLDPVLLVAPVLYRRWPPPSAVRVTRPLRDGEVIGGGWVTVFTPGHTHGHTSFFHPETRTLIAGDALGSVRFGRLRLPKRAYAEDWVAAMNSVRVLAALEPEVICFGHGPDLHGARALLKDLAAVSLTVD